MQSVHGHRLPCWQAPLQSLNECERVIYIGRFNKALFGLRLGHTIGPAVARLARILENWFSFAMLSGYSFTAPVSDET